MYHHTADYLPGVMGEMMAWDSWKQFHHHPYAQNYPYRIHSSICQTLMAYQSLFSTMVGVPVVALINPPATVAKPLVNTTAALATKPRVVDDCNDGVVASLNTVALAAGNA